jgi:ketosteroid isomerase-like protein
MSQENVEIVRGFYESGVLDSGSTSPVEGFLDGVDPDVEFINPPDAIEPGVRRGRAAFRAAMESATQAFDWWSHERRELYDEGDSVVASVVSRARGRGGAVDVTQDEAHTWTFLEGRLVRFEWGRDLSRALEAVGLSE